MACVLFRSVMSWTVPATTKRVCFPQQPNVCASRNNVCASRNNQACVLLPATTKRVCFPQQRVCFPQQPNVCASRNNQTCVPPATTKRVCFPQQRVCFPQQRVCNNVCAFQVGYVTDGSRKRASVLRQVIADAGRREA